MTIDRRTLLRFSAAGAAALATGGRIAFAAPGPIDEIQSSALGYFGKHGFAELPPLSMITGEAFNGGIRFDETDNDSPSGPTIRVQPAARVDDIADRSLPGVLALFNIIGLRDADAEGGTLLSRVMDFLTNARQLDPGRMLFVSTELLRPQIGRVDGVSADRVIERPMDEAKAAGDGSGFFAPAGHPLQPAYPTVSLHYPLPGIEPDPSPTYPPEGYIEIAEIGLPSPDGAGDTGAGIGLERVAMAEGEDVPDFERTLLNLLRIIEDEAARTGKPLPDGYTKFASL